MKEKIPPITPAEAEAAHALHREALQNNAYVQYLRLYNRRADVLRCIDKLTQDVERKTKALSEIKILVPERYRALLP